MRNISIKIKVLVPIIILSLVIVLACGFSMFNQKNLLNTSYVISDDCSKSIELLLDMKSNLESIGKNMYAHCKAENATTKAQFGDTIQGQIGQMEEYFSQYESTELTSHANQLISYIQETILPDYDNFVNAGVQYNSDANHVNQIVRRFHVMSDELTKQSQSVQQYADSISTSVRESSEGIHNAASNTEDLSNEITNISDKFNINKEVANSLGREAERFII